MRSTIQTVVLVALAAMLVPCRATAEINFESSHTSALQKAKRTGRPICILFPYRVTSGSLDGFRHRVLRDAEVEKLCSKFIFLVLSRGNNRRLAEKYGVVYRGRGHWLDIVFIDKSENILCRSDLYCMRDTFIAHARKALSLAGPIVSKKDDKSIDIGLRKGKKAFENHDYRVAISYLGPVSKAQLDDPRVTEAKELMRTIQQEGRDKLSEILESTDPESASRAIRELEEIAREYEGCSVGETARGRIKEMLSDPELAQMRRETEANELLEKALASEADEDYRFAMAQLQRLVRDYSDTEAGATAEDRLRGLKSDDRVTQILEDAKATKKCRSWLSLAHSFELNEDYEKAIEYYDKVIAEFPSSSFAADARNKRDKANEMLK